MKLTREVKAYTKTMYFSWCQKSFQLMGKRFRQNREGLKPMNKCGWCNHRFSDGEMMALAQPKDAMNMLLCQSCANELKGD